jgi:acetyl-CoA synthetase
MFEGVPTYPGPDRYWDMVDRHKITTFYTSPTALKTVARFGDEHVKKHSLASLRVLGSVGEPLNAEIWRWYYNIVGKERCSIVDTYWQTETGGAIIAPLANVTPMKPGSASLPFFGIEIALMDGHGKEIIGAGSGVLALKRHWPGISRTVLADHKKYLDTYFSEYGGNVYFTGDGATRDAQGYIYITGRVDDVLKKAGHRIGTSEIESALLMSPLVAEAAVVGVPDEIKGEAIVVFAILKSHVREDTGETSLELVADLKSEVRRHVGAIATPDYVIFTDWLPKTRSGKVMRRLLRKIAEGDTSNLGDLSTLNDPQFMPLLIKRTNAVMASTRKIQ